MWPMPALWSLNTAGARESAAGSASTPCWQRNGFQVVGTLPGAFHHSQFGYVDALVMIQALVEGPTP